MEKLIWVKKKIGKVAKGAADVIISQVNDYTKNATPTVIQFKNNSYLRITKNTYITFAVSGTRLYFKQEEPRDGYKLTGFNKDGTSATVKVHQDVLPINVNVEVGSYNLEWDPVLGLHYVDILHKLK